MFCVLSKRLRYLEKLCVLSQNQLSSDKLFLFTLQLAVVTARIFTMERFVEFYFELGPKYKAIQSVLSTMHGFGTFLPHKTIKVG